MSDLMGAADQRDSFPIYTYLMAAGLSPADVRTTGDEIKRRVRESIKQKALRDDLDSARRYMRDPEYRALVNEDVIANVVLGMGFEIGELRKLERAMRLNGLAPREAKGVTVARTNGPNGPEDFELLSATAVRSRRTGKVFQF